VPTHMGVALIGTILFAISVMFRVWGYEVELPALDSTRPRSGGSLSSLSAVWPPGRYVLHRGRDRLSLVHAPGSHLVLRT